VAAREAPDDRRPFSEAGRRTVLCRRCVVRNGDEEQEEADVELSEWESTERMDADDKERERGLLEMGLRPGADMGASFCEAKVLPWIWL
jgi:hypothetical protein